MLNDKQVEDYLKRISYEGNLQITEEVLSSLVYHHQCSIPFSTVDIYQKPTPPDMNPELLFDKVVLKKRGGFCFELNYLFELLLTKIGFSARPILCRAVRGRPGRMPINHRGIIVSINDEDWFVDVGFGGPLAAGALKLEDGLAHVIRNEHYWMKKVDDYWWAIERKTRDKSDLYGDEGPSRIQVELELCTAPVEHIDFDALSLYWSRPGTVFHDLYLCNLRTVDGFRSLRGNVLNINKDGVSNKIQIPDKEELDNAVEKYFGFRP